MQKPIANDSSICEQSKLLLLSSLSSSNSQLPINQSQQPNRPEIEARIIVVNRACRRRRSQTYNQLPSTFLVLWTLTSLLLITLPHNCMASKNLVRDKIRSVTEDRLRRTGALLTPVHDGIELIVVNKNRKNKGILLEYLVGFNKTWWITITPCVGEQYSVRWEHTRHDREPRRDVSQTVSQHRSNSSNTFVNQGQSRIEFKGPGSEVNDVVVIRLTDAQPGNVFAVRLSTRMSYNHVIYGYPPTPKLSTPTICLTDSKSNTILIQWHAVPKQLTQVHYCVAINAQEDLYYRCTALTRLQQLRGERKWLSDTSRLRKSRPIENAVYQCSNSTSMKIKLPAKLARVIHPSRPVSSAGQLLYVNVYAINSRVDLSSAYAVATFGQSLSLPQQCSLVNQRRELSHDVRHDHLYPMLLNYRVSFAWPPSGNRDSRKRFPPALHNSSFSNSNKESTIPAPSPPVGVRSERNQDASRLLFGIHDDPASTIVFQPCRPSILTIDHTIRLYWTGNRRNIGFNHDLDDDVFQLRVKSLDPIILPRRIKRPGDYRIQFDSDSPQLNSRHQLIQFLITTDNDTSNGRSLLRLSIKSASVLPKHIITRPASQNAPILQSPANGEPICNHTSFSTSDWSAGQGHTEQAPIQFGVDCKEHQIYTDFSIESHLRYTVYTLPVPTSMVTSQARGSVFERLENVTDLCKFPTRLLADIGLVGTRSPLECTTTDQSPRRLAALLPAYHRKGASRYYLVLVYASRSSDQLKRLLEQHLIDACQLVQRRCYPANSRSRPVKVNCSAVR